MSGVKHTPGPLTVRVSERWPYDIETMNSDGRVVFSDRMPAHSTAMRSHNDLWKGEGFPAREREEVVELNRRAVADATIRAAAPDLLEAAQNFIRWAEEPADDSVGMAREQGWIEQARAAIARARGEQDGGGHV